jgi:lipid II:glycine glycyltransferase (peptidoglycan interpeptide bridge formation enzyme)
MHPKTRYNIKKKSKQLHTWVSTDVEQFASFWQKCALTQRKMFLSQEKEIINLYKAFKKNAQIAVVSDNSEKDWLSAVLTISSEKTTYYMFAASTLLGKKSFAPTINVWQCIKLAKKAKDKIFDFGGIYDERFPLKSWLGFTRFKKSFGGTIVKYPGAFYKSKLPFISI